MMVQIDAEQARRATGNDDPLAQTQLIGQLRDSLWLPDGLEVEEQARRVQAAMAMLEAIGPQDGIEGLLAVQMTATHNAVLECLRRAMLDGEHPAVREQSLKHAAKLLDIYMRQVEALDRHRGKGPPRLTVENVNVGAGGQAIVGSVRHGEAAARSPVPRAAGASPTLPHRPAPLMDTARRAEPALVRPGPG